MYTYTHTIERQNKRIRSTRNVSLFRPIRELFELGYGLWTFKLTSWHSPITHIPRDIQDNIPPSNLIPSHMAVPPWTTTSHSRAIAPTSLTIPAGDYRALRPRTADPLGTRRRLPMVSTANQATSHPFLSPLQLCRRILWNPAQVPSKHTILWFSLPATAMLCTLCFPSSLLYR